MREGGYSDQNEDDQKEKIYCKGNEGIYILGRNLINGETWFHNLGGLDVSYHSDTPFERIDYGYTTKCRLGMIFITW